MSADDDRVQPLLRALVPDPEVTIDPDRVRRGARRRTTRAAVAGATALTLAVVGGAAWSATQRSTTPVDAPATGTTPDPDPTTDPTSGSTGSPGWHRGGDLPLSPRWDPLAVWTGTEALVFGGLSQAYVGGPAPFTDLRDGAAYDPATDTWRPLAEAPVSLGTHGVAVLAGEDRDTLVIADFRGWLAYDVSTDAWRRLPDPPVDIPQPTIAADASGHVYAVDVYVHEGATEAVQVLDLGTETWSEIPAVPGAPQLDQRTLVVADDRLVVVADDLAPRQAGEEQEVARAAAWDGRRWTSYPVSDAVGYQWHWTGERIVPIGRSTRHQAQALDPATGTWTPLPDLPPWRRGQLEVGNAVADGDRYVWDGHLHDDATGTSRPVPSLGRASTRPVRGGIVLGGGHLMSFGGYLAPDWNGERVFQVEPVAATWVLDLD